MPNDTGNMNRMDGLVKRKVNSTEESLVQSMSEMQKTNMQLMEEMKALKAQMLSERGVSPHSQGPVSDAEEEEERKWVPPDEEQKRVIAQGWDEKSDELL